jgi:recombination protein RecA
MSDSKVLVAVKAIENKYGKGSIRKMGDQPLGEIPRWSTGSLILDKRLGGGIPLGMTVELYGWESSGKSSLATIIASNIQRSGKLVGYIDMENTFDPLYAQKLGIDIDLLYIAQPSSGEEAADIAEELIKSGEFGGIIYDSVAAMIPRAELEGDYGDSKMGLHARLMSQIMRKCTSLAKIHKTTLIFINQIREKIGVVYGNPETTTGGNALRFYASQRLQISRGKNIEDSDKHVVGFEMRVKIKKNKTADPFGDCELAFMIGKGFSRSREILDIAVEQDIVKKSGSWYSYGDIKLGQGSDTVIELMDDNPEMVEEIFKKLKI